MMISRPIVSRRIARTPVTDAPGSHSAYGVDSRNTVGGRRTKLLRHWSHLPWDIHRPTSSAATTATSLKSSEAAALGQQHYTPLRQVAVVPSPRCAADQPAAISHTHSAVARSSTIFSTAPPRCRDVVTSHVVIRNFQSVTRSRSVTESSRTCRNIRLVTASCTTLTTLHVIANYTVSQNVHLFIFQLTLSKLADFNDFFCVWNPEKIWHQ